MFQQRPLSKRRRPVEPALPALVSRPCCSLCSCSGSNRCRAPARQGSPVEASLDARSNHDHRDQDQDGGSGACRRLSRQRRVVIGSLRDGVRCENRGASWLEQVGAIRRQAEVCRRWLSRARATIASVGGRSDWRGGELAQRTGSGEIVLDAVVATWGLAMGLDNEVERFRPTIHPAPPPPVR